MSGDNYEWAHDGGPQVTDLKEVPIKPQKQTTFNHWEGIPDGLTVSSIWYDTVFSPEGRRVTQEETCVFLDLEGHSLVVGGYKDHDYIVAKIQHDKEWVQSLLRIMRTGEYIE